MTRSEMQGEAHSHRAMHIGMVGILDPKCPCL